VDPQLSFWHRGTFPRFASALVEISVNYGQSGTYTALATYSFLTINDWTLEQLDLSDYVGLTNVRIRFRYYDNGWTGGVWDIDDVRISEPDAVSITGGPSGVPDPVGSAETANLSVTASDSWDHPLNYNWTADCSAWSAGNGSFNDSTLPDPTWTAPSNSTGSTQNCSISVTVDDGEFGKSDTGSYTQGIVGIPKVPPGDCNGDGLVDAGDISATILEIFDPTFAGTEGCDSNGDGKVDAGDIYCVKILVFGGTCGDSSSSTQV